MGADHYELASILSQHIATLDSAGERFLYLDISWWRHFGWLEECGYNIGRTGEAMAVRW